MFTKVNQRNNTQCDMITQLRYFHQYKKYLNVLIIKRKGFYHYILFL